MHTLTSPNPHGSFADVDTLVCPGCQETAIPEPPFLRGLDVVAAGEFSHRDGSQLCHDRHGRTGEPIEARR